MSFYRNVIAITAVFISTNVLAANINNNAVQNASGPNSPVIQTSDNATDAAKTSITQQNKVNINTASLQDLMNVKGMNKLKAKSIVRYRNQHLFKSLDELSSVKGFKKMDKENLKAIQEQMSI